MNGHDTAEGEARGDEAVRQAGDRLGGALQQDGLPDLPVRVVHRDRVVVEGVAVEHVHRQHLMAVLAQPLGGIEDALSDAEDGREQRHGGHASLNHPREPGRDSG